MYFAKYYSVLNLVMHLEIYISILKDDIPMHALL